MGGATPEVGRGEGHEGEKSAPEQARDRGGGLDTEAPPEQPRPHVESRGGLRRRKVSEGASSPVPLATARPAVRYPSPGTLDQLRHSSQTHGGHWRPAVPEEEASCLSEEMVSSLNETLGSEGTPVPAHSGPEHSSGAAIGEVVSQASSIHL